MKRFFTTESISFEKKSDGFHFKAKGYIIFWLIIISMFGLFAIYSNFIEKIMIFIGR